MPNYLFSLFSIIFSCSSFLSSIFFSLFKIPSFLSLSSSPLLNTLPSGEYANFGFYITSGLYPKSSPVKYS